MKEGISITIDRKILENFDEMLEEKMISRSRMLEHLMQNEIENYAEC